MSLIMTEDEVRILADRIIQPILAPVGFTSADVEARPNHAGEDSLFVKVHFKSGSAVAPGKTYGEAMMSVRNALLDRGEDRFPYLDWDYPDDPADAELETEAG